ncbi:NifB/NifX family molybdenum-iron cluster-binding protein [Methanogenium cariaci]|jgi:predicted Fe-Mo cluster-binding NifX family protein|uniref:NifB/NifX family molybdenum-iron cluster-binding protein n=1 Tax=Methanogenium cariaci TaxID=2197 RepID=UPI00078145B6|nr:NifB/NifX family molybdenum-iron cluster-binding protein [Methanogenium cariaci]
MKLCIPINEDNGLESIPYSHFGSASAFLLVDTDTGVCSQIPPTSSTHGSGGCAPAAELAEHAVEAVLVGGIGRGAIMSLNGAGIKVFCAIPGTVGANVQALNDGMLSEMDPAGACAGHSHDNGGC